MLTAAELGIQQWEYDSLIFFMQKLLTGEYKLDMNNSSPSGKDQPVSSTCGSVFCLGGNMLFKRITEGEHPFYAKESMSSIKIGEISEMMDSYVWKGGDNFNDRLRMLFFPSDWYSTDWEQIPPEYVGHAISNFLNTGYPNWKSLHKDYINSKN